MNKTYATLANLAEYLMIPEVNLPQEALRLLKRSSETILQVTLNNARETEEHLEALKLATCAQVEYILEVSESITIIDGIKAISLGKFSLQFGETSKRLSPRARAYLAQAGLLYRGV